MACWRLFGLVLFPLASVVHAAATDLDDEVYGATIPAGETELEARYGRFTGDEANGSDALVLEAGHGFSRRLFGATLVTLAGLPNSSPRLESVAVEGILALGSIKGLGVETALYVEVEHALDGPDELETKLLLEHRRGPFDARFNLVAQRPLSTAAPLEIGYAASAEYELVDAISLGAEAFGNLRAHEKSGAANHYVGPLLRAELDHIGSGELELRAAYLLRLGPAPTGAKRQLRLGLEYEF